MSNKFNARAASPGFCFIEITHECNLHCQMCHLWTTKEDSSKSLGTDKKIQVIRDFKGMNPYGTVVFTGGETLRKKSEFLTLCRTCHELGLNCSVNTNGTLIDRETAKQLVDFGPQYLVVSLDSIHPDLHDSYRGVKGTYERATNAIKMLVEEKSLNPSSTTGIYTNCIVMESNYRELPEYIDLVNGLGCNGVMFQMLSRTFGLKSKTDVFFQNHFPRDVVDFTNKISDLRDRISNDGFVKTGSQSFDYMLMYAREPDFVSTEVCASGENNLIVDSYGNVQLCFNMHQLTGGKFLGNVRDKRLTEMWSSTEAADYREIMKNCRKSCGILNCHRRSDQ